MLRRPSLRYVQFEHIRAIQLLTQIIDIASAQSLGLKNNAKCEVLRRKDLWEVLRDFFDVTVFIGSLEKPEGRYEGDCGVHDDV